MRRRSLVKLLLFASLVFIGDRVGAYGLSVLVGRTGLRFPMIYAGDLPADIVILGNSRGIHMFHPPPIEEVTGARVANLSFNDLSTTLMPIFWEDYLQRHDPPRMLVLEVSAVTETDRPASLERFSFLMDRNSKLGNAIREKNKTHYYVSQFSHLFRFNSPLTWRSLLFFKKNDQDWIMDSQLNPEMMEASFDERIELRRDEQRLQQMKQVVQLAQRHDVEVRAVIGPYAPKYLENLEGYSEWVRWLESSLGVQVHNYSESLQSMDGFADPTHLNATGAADLAERLHQDGFFEGSS